MRHVVLGPFYNGRFAVYRVEQASLNVSVEATRHDKQSLLRNQPFIESVWLNVDCCGDVNPIINYAITNAFWFKILANTGQQLFRSFPQ